MMKRQFAKLMLMGILAMGGSLQAEEGLRVEVGQSSLPRMQEMRLDAQYASCDECPCDCVDEKPSDKEETETCSQYLVIDGKVNRYGKAFHLLTDISNDMIELQNGSWWVVNPYDVSKLRIWGRGADEIVVMQDTSWFFNNNKYRLVNTTTGDVVAADLKLGPFVDRVTVIENIDPYDGYIELSDGSVWKIASWDNSIYYDKSSTDLAQRRWLKTDVVIVGANASYIGGPFILINVNLNKVARAWYDRSSY